LADPEAQQAKVERTAEIRRLESLLPRQAVDSKVLIYRLREGEDRPALNAKPRITLLASELEQAQADGADAGSVIESRITEKYDSGRFLCRVVDRKGAAVPAFSPWIVDLDDAADDGEDDGDDAGGDDGGDEAPPVGNHGRGGQIPGYAPAPQGINPMTGLPWEYAQTYQPHGYAQGYQAAPPPPPQDFDRAPVVAAAKEAREDEARRSSELVTVMAQMQQQSTQMLLAMQQQAREEARQREEREEKRRAERTQTLLALAPTLLPILERFIAPKPQQTGLTPEMTILIETLKSRDNSSSMKDMMGFMFEAAKAQTSLQAQAAQTAIATQADLMGVVNKNMMEQLKNAWEVKGGESGGKDNGGGVMDTIVKLAPALMAGLAQGAAQAPAAPSFNPAPEAQALPAPAPAPVVTPAVPVQKVPAPAAPVAPVQKAPAPAKPAPSEDERILGCLNTIMQMEQGKVPAEQRWDALRWCLDTMPDSLKNAIRADSEGQVMSLGSNAVMRSAELLTWIGDEKHIGFLRACVSDMRLLLTATLDAHRAASAVTEMRDYLAQKGAVQAAPAPVAAPEAAPVAPEPAAPTPEPVAEAPAPATEEVREVQAEVVGDEAAEQGRRGRGRRRGA
jgi:hypothetical protein